jgi:taurine transport system permease protein
MAVAGPIHHEPRDDGPRNMASRATAAPKQSWRRLPQWPLMLLLPSGLIALWYLSSKANTVISKFIPTPTDVLDTGYDIFTAGYRGSSIFEHTWVSLSHVIYAFLIISLVGIPIGWLMGRLRVVQFIVDPLVEFLRPLPPLAYLSLLIIWFGIGTTTQIALLVASGFAVIVTAARAASAGVSEEKIKTARAFGADHLQIFWHVILPSTLPDLITGSRVLAGMLFSTIIAAEMIAARSGLGWMIMDASQFLRSDVIFVGIFILAILGFAIDRSFRLLERVLVPWRGKE